MIVLDTNTVYYLCGISNGPISKKDLAKYIIDLHKQNDLCVSMYSIQEIVAKYHKQANKFRKIICVLRSYGIFPYIDSNESMKYKKSICEIRQKSLDIFWRDVEKKKVETESKYATAIFMCILLVTSCLECVDDINSVSDSFLCIVKRLSLLEQETVSECFVKIYDIAYEKNDTKEIIREAFYGLLDIFLSISIPIVRDAYNTRSDDEGNISIPLVDTNNTSAIVQRAISRKDTPLLYASSIAKKYEKKVNDKNLTKFLFKLDEAIGRPIKDESMKEYFIEIVNSCITKGRAFQKNDIIDAMILCCLKDDDAIISFDNGMIEHMKKYKDKRPAYQNSLNEIQKLDNLRTS